ncbi:MAG: hypothetical protein L3K06_02170 [Thermoplasmata archaeon]|nr:hypothetical protein [Thermoplasmata archaeon]
MFTFLALLCAVLLLPTPVIAKTTVTPFTASKLLVRTGGNTLPAVSVVAHGLLKVTAAISRDPRAGTTAGGANGLAGTVRTLPACTVGVCNDSYRGAGMPRLTTGHFAEWLEVSLVQPRAATGTAFGFVLELAVHTTAGWFVAVGYFSSGTTTAGVVHTIHPNLLVDLGTAIAPTVLAVDSAMSACATAARCP